MRFWDNINDIRMSKYKYMKSEENMIIQNDEYIVVRYFYKLA